MTEPRPHPYNGRLTEGPDEPLPDLPRPTPPTPNAEDRKAASEMGVSAEYVAELRTVGNVHDWEAARAAERERQQSK